jgi:hypothetical protein
VAKKYCKKSSIEGLKILPRDGKKVLQKSSIEGIMGEPRRRPRGIVLIVSPLHTLPPLYPHIGLIRKSSLIRKSRVLGNPEY